jgi:7-keto-8-aminopelargonate synthetase-like enzyme
LNDKYHIEEKLEDYRWFRKAKFILNMRKLSKQAKSLNQTQVFLGKYLLNMPIDEDESEVKSYNDIASRFGKDWPYMIQIRDTKAAKPLVNGKPVTCISSYAYLDLGRDERVQEAAITAARQYSTGNHGPRMLCGNLEILEELEVVIGKFFKRDAALVFSSGYLACMSCLAGITRKNDLLLMDKLSHASLKAGSKLCGAQTKYFKHNNFKDAERII